MKEYKELRIAIIGCGMISHRHMTVIENLNKRGYNLRVVAAAEIDKEKLEKWGKQYGVAEENLYQDFREMLKRDDTSSISSLFNISRKLKYVYTITFIHLLQQLLWQQDMTAIQRNQWQQAMQMQRFSTMHRKNMERNWLYRSALSIIHRHVSLRR